MARFRSTVPTRCIERHPSRNTVYFAGVPINLSMIARSYDPPLDLPYLSRIFKGHRMPSVRYAKTVAEALGMQWQSLFDHLEQQQNAKTPIKMGA